MGIQWMSFDNSASVQSRDGAITVPTLIIGLGNPILGDDGIGWRVAESVKKHYPPAEIDCLSVGGLSLMERLIGYQKVIIIDAIQTQNGSIGQVYTLPLESLPDLSSGHTTAVHDTSLQTALHLGRMMGAKLPNEVMVVAIEADRVYDFSEELTEPVKKAIPEATRAVLALLEPIE